MERITPENCRNMLSKYKSLNNLEEKASAWSVVYYFCRQNNMTNSYNNSGIESVITFIDNLIKNQK